MKDNDSNWALFKEVSIENTRPEPLGSGFLLVLERDKT
jgi:hypothetical protein